MLNIAEKLKDFRISSGRSQQEFADLVGVSQRTWSSYESGQTTPKMDVLFALAEKGFTIKGVTSIPMDDWPEEAKEGFRERLQMAKEGAFPLDMHLESGGQYLDHISTFDLFKFSHGKPISVPANDEDPNALVLIPVYSQRASAGPGQPPTQMEAVEAYIPIVYELLGGAHPRNCGAVRVAGDSMTDMALYNGDLVIFDKSQLEGNGVFVISIGCDVRIKRLEYRIFEKKIIISSENQKSYPDPEIVSFEEAQETLMIHGKVISWIHRHPY